MPLQISASEFLDFDGKKVVKKKAIQPANPSERPQFSLHVGAAPLYQNTLVTPAAGREMIREYFKDIWNESTKQGEIIGVDFDKQTLQLILSQNNCAAIRFIFCKFQGETTLVGFGTDDAGKLLGEEMFKPSAAKGDPSVLGGEQGHKTTLGEFKKAVGEPLAPDFGKLADTYISQSLR